LNKDLCANGAGIINNAPRSRMMIYKWPIYWSAANVLVIANKAIDQGASQRQRSTASQVVIIRLAVDSGL